MKGLIKTGMVARYLGTSAQTIRNYDYKQILTPCLVTKAGTRYYDEQKVIDFKKERLESYEKSN